MAVRAPGACERLISVTMQPENPDVTSPTPAGASAPKPSAATPAERHPLHPQPGEPLVFDPFPVCILGLGLIGGSLLRDLADAGWPTFGWNRSVQTVEAARADGYDASADLELVLQRAEREGALVVLGVPAPALPSILDAIGRHSPSVGMTDVTSVKGEVQALVERMGMADRFVGGHPMAGTANSGWEATMTGLFAGAVWVVGYDRAVAGDRTDIGELPELWFRTFRRVVRVAQAVGAMTIPSRAAQHDRAVARISHLPHVFAETLAVVGDAGGPLSLALAAGSFRDTTRVAGTAPGLVQAMCEGNREALLECFDEALAILGNAREALAQGDLSELTEAGFAARKRYEATSKHGSSTEPHPVIRVSPGVRGWVEQLLSAESIGARIEIF